MSKAAWRSPFETEDTGCPAKDWIRYSIRFSQPKPMEWAWVCRSAAPSSKPTTGGCRCAPTLIVVSRSNSRCQFPGVFTMPDAEPTVFVVDDDHAVRKSLHMLIKSVGLNVETFSSAQEFLDSYDPEHPGCLVLDVRMPRMSGLELQNKLTESGINIPVIIVTGHGDVPIAVRAMKAGAVDFIEKPFSNQ